MKSNKTFIFPTEAWQVRARIEDDAWIVIPAEELPQLPDSKRCRTAAKPRCRNTINLIVFFVGWALLVWVLSSTGILQDEPDLHGPDERAHAAAGHRLAGGGL